MDRLTFDPTKDKQKVVKKMRQDLQKKKLSSCEPSLPKSSRIRIIQCKLTCS